MNFSESSTITFKQQGLLYHTVIDGQVSKRGATTRKNAITHGERVIKGLAKWESITDHAIETFKRGWFSND